MNLKNKKSTFMGEQGRIKSIRLILFIVAVLIFVIVTFDHISSFFFEGNESSRGEFLKVVLTFVAAIIAILVWRTNTDRVKVMDESNVEDRYNNALGCLGSENDTLVLGGIHTLYQIAKKDKRYTEIVHDIFCDYLRENSTKLYENIPEDSGRCPAIIQTLIKYLFGKIKDLYIFKDFKSDLSFSTLRNVNFDDSILEDCWFDHATLIKCKFVNASLKNCRIYASKLKDCGFYNGTELINCMFWRGVELINCRFHSTDKFMDNNSYKGAALTNCAFYEGAILTRCNFGFVTLIDCEFSLNSTNASLDEFTKDSLHNYSAMDLSTQESLTKLEIDNK